MINIKTYHSSENDQLSQCNATPKNRYSFRGGTELHSDPGLVLRAPVVEPPNRAEFRYESQMNWPQYIYNAHITHLFTGATFLHLRLDVK